MAEPKVVEGRARFGAYETWFRVTGDLSAAKRPVFILHGGPGAAHNYTDSLKALALQGRAVVQYDQLGCGNSTLLPDKGKDFWTPQLFVEELNNLIDHLGARIAYHVLGQSWGGMLGSEFAITRPQGLRSLVIANSPASMELWVEAAEILRRDLPKDVQETLTRHERAGTTSDPEYKAAERVFYERHLCRLHPFPAELQASLDQVARNPTVYNTMNGPNEFFVTGTLKTWSVIDRVHRIDVPTLLISGRYDEAQPMVVQPFKDNIKGARWEIFENSSHVPHIEEKEKFMRLVGEFLDHND
jgi:L-proline amide hydrolase